MANFKRYLREAINNVCLPCLREQEIPNVDVGQDVYSPIMTTGGGGSGRPHYEGGCQSLYPPYCRSCPPGERWSLLLERCDCGGSGPSGGVCYCVVTPDGQQIAGPFNSELAAWGYRNEILKHYKKDCGEDDGGEDDGGSMGDSQRNVFVKNPDVDLFGGRI